MTGSLQVKKNQFYMVLSFQDETGKWKHKWIKTGLEVRGNKTRAKEMLRHTLEEYDKKNINYADITAWEYFQRWLEEKENSVTKSTYRSYKGNMENHIIPYFKELGIKLQQLKAYHLEDYYTFKLNTPGEDGKKLSPQTVRHHHQNLSKALNDAVRREIIPFNPAHNAKAPKVPKFRGAYLNPKQLKIMLSLFKDSPVEHPIQMITTYGLRRSECLGLCWQYVDFENEQFTIARTVIQHPGQDYVRDTTKNDSSYRTLPMTGEIKAMLRAIQEDQQENRELFGNCYHESDFVFTQKDGTPISPNYLTRVFHKTMESSDLPTIRLHDLRHSTATNLLANSFSVVEVQHWLGHSQPSTTLNFYSHVDSQSKRHISDALEKLIPLE